MIRPTLFIGLGTTGTNILKSLRQLMSEEYAHAGLPIFRYIAIETNGDVNVDNTNQMKDYEQIHLVSATIDNFAAIRRKLTPREPQYNPELAEWLNPDLLNFALNFRAGAANIRMAGRLCLWENWEDMQATLNTAYAAIQATLNTNEANEILAQHYESKGLPVDDINVGDNIHIYVVGSLCGGTCSGMVIDTAYFCRNLLVGNDGNEIRGIFTMHDPDLAADNAALAAVHAANCYGSLWELNYYNHPQTIYNVTFPNNLGVGDPNQTPFDDTMFVSRSSGDGNHIFVDARGNFDESGLNLMVALNLFAETAGDTSGLRRAIGIDGRALPGFGELKDVREGQISVMVRFMASFGLTAVWYPKYRIASASASLISQKLCGNWLDLRRPPPTIKSEANSKWQEILNQNIGILTNPRGLQSLKVRIGQLLGSAKTRFNSARAATLKSMIEQFPDDEPFKNKFDEGGEYFELIEQQMPKCKQALCDAIEETLHNQLANIDFGGKHGLGDVQRFFEDLDKEIKNTIEECPALAPSLDLNQLDFEPMHSAENNRWTKAIGLHNRSVEAHRKELIDKYCGLISESPSSIYVAVRNHFLRSILQKVREKLGFGVTPPGADNAHAPATIKQRLKAISTKLRGCVEKFEVDYNAAIDLQTSECVKIVTSNPENRIDTDAEQLSFDMTSAIERDDIGLLQGETMTAFLEKGQEEIADQMMETYRQLSLERIQVNDVVQEALDSLNAGNDNIRNLASRSNPYQAFQAIYQPLVAPHKIIFGRDPAGNALPTLQNELEFSHQGDSSVDHLLFFYQEDMGFALDDLAAYEALKQHFDQTPGAYGHLTHQDPNVYDLELEHKIDRLKRWSQVLTRLVPEICNRINNEAFEGLFRRLDNDTYGFDYHVDGVLQTLGLYDDPDGIRRLAHSRAPGQGNNEAPYDRFVMSVQLRFNQLGREQITDQIINPLLTQVQDRNIQHQLGEVYMQFLDEVYSNGEDAHTEGELDEHFLPVNPANTQGEPHAEPAQGHPEPEADTAGYDEITSEEAEYNAGPFTQKVSDSGTEYYKATTTGHETGTSSDDTIPQGSDTDDKGDEYVWTEAEAQAEPNPTDKPTGEAQAEVPFTDQDTRPEATPVTEEQEKQGQPPKEFSVADLDVKQLTHKKE